MKLSWMSAWLLALGCDTLRTPAHKPNTQVRDYSIIAPRQGNAAAQNVITWDEHSLFVNGTRVLILSGEFHPFRLPVPSLWLDVFQKVRALGFNAVSFYVDWALLEGNPGQFTAEGVFALEPFFDAAQEAGLWLIARPGPYINAEVRDLYHAFAKSSEVADNIPIEGERRWLPRLAPTSPGALANCCPRLPRGD